MALDTISPSSEEDYLEKILKEAKVLASTSKMATLIDAPEGASNYSSGHSKSTDVVKKDQPPTSDASLAQSDQQEDIEEVLRQSELLLDKMRSKVSLGSTATPFGIVKDCDREKTPSSVYVLHHNSSSSQAADDFSSVGSQSLRQINFDPNSPAPIKNTDDLADASAEFMANALKEIALTNSDDTPSPSEPNDGDLVPISDHSVVSLASNKNRANAATSSPMNKMMQSQIPDFSKSTPGAKYEKVICAKQGDDDFVSLVDYSAQKRSSPQQQTTGLDMNVKRSRLAQYKRQAKRDRKRRRYVTVGVAIVSVLVCLFWFRANYNRGSTHEATPQPTAENATAIMEAQLEAEGEALREAETAARIAEQQRLQDETRLRAEVQARLKAEKETRRAAEEEARRVTEEGQALIKAEEEARLAAVKSKSLSVANASVNDAFKDQVWKAMPRCKNWFARIFKKNCRVLEKERRLARQEAEKDEKKRKIMNTWN
jgi:hypothetical protein